MAIRFSIDTKIPGKLGRAGTLETPHGVIKTPAFVPVGTKGTVKALTPEQVASLGAQVVLANTYHLHLQPGDETVKNAGGLHKFMNWHGPTMTDSGGFQVFSLGTAYGKGLSKILKGAMKPGDAAAPGMEGELGLPDASVAELDENGNPRREPNDMLAIASVDPNGVTFRSHLDGSAHYITPEISIDIQHNLGADIIFAFDECTSPLEPMHYQREALDRTHRWAKRSLDHHRAKEEEKKRASENGASEKNGAKATQKPQALFGIVQGGRSQELREESARVISGMDFDGFGIGGSFAKEDMITAVSWVNNILPEEKPRHLLGIGEPEDLFMGVELGVDLFDCVAATRMARNGGVYTSTGKLNLSNTKFRDDFTPIEAGCECYTCKHYTRAYVAHLFRAKEMLAATLASIHNLYFIVKLVDTMREKILEGKFEEFKNEFLKKYRS